MVAMQLQRDIEFPKRFNLSPSMKSSLKRNVAVFAAGFKEKFKNLQTQVVEQSGDSRNLDDRADLRSALSKFSNLNLDEGMHLVEDNERDDKIIKIILQIKDLEKYIEEQKDWAHKSVIGAARKLSNDLTELKMLRMEREETLKSKRGKPTLDDSTMKRLSEMEDALRRASGQADRANANVRRIELENAEIKAEIEASKLSASESVDACKEVEKREKKFLKKLKAWEKQKAKLEQEISDEREKVLKTQEELAQIKQSREEAKVKWKEELNAKEEALALVEEERQAKETAESENKRKLEALRVKIEIDFQRHKDDLSRLEEEISRLKASAQSAESSSITNSEDAMPQWETAIANLLQELDDMEDHSEKEVKSNRECIMCMKDRVSIVFLPCAHQVMCASCSAEHGRKGKTACPYCRVQIQQRIRVFGIGS
ncbi:MND1-interacting protein 1-like [Gastrolobium bilobum]|uniref:MND1-interacting protein 1-like n=1 Tax=Gastrolobium bilobum TaxID=150636 RepID=UPI002AB082AC|nr:MND1-interacting protein 1-like [Gastrolobium bilobum]